MEEPRAGGAHGENHFGQAEEEGNRETEGAHAERQKRTELF